MIIKLHCNEGQRNTLFTDLINYLDLINSIRSKRSLSRFCVGIVHKESIYGKIRCAIVGDTHHSNSDIFVVYEKNETLKGALYQILNHSCYTIGSIYGLHNLQSWIEIIF